MKSALDRFIEKFKINDETGCWEWTAGLNGDAGYGSFNDGIKMVLAHRFAYETLVGPIPNGLEIDHLCRVRHCINPSHLEPVTRQVNILRGMASTMLKLRAAAIRFCKHGHEFTAENTSYSNGNGYRKRQCKTCRRNSDKDRYARNRVEVLAKRKAYHAAKKTMTAQAATDARRVALCLQTDRAENFS